MQRRQEAQSLLITATSYSPFTETFLWRSLLIIILNNLHQHGDGGRIGQGERYRSLPAPSGMFLQPCIKVKNGGEAKKRTEAHELDVSDPRRVSSVQVHQLEPRAA